MRGCSNRISRRADDWSRPARRTALLALLGGGLLPTASWTQISKPSEAELSAAPAQFQDLVHGRSDKINQNAAQAARAQAPPDARPQRAVAVNPSRDPRDLRGNWTRGGGPGGGPPGGAAGALPPGGGPGGGLTDPRPGTYATTTIDANRMCLVSLGVNLAPMKVYQTDRQLTFVYSNELRARRIYYSAAHPVKVVPTYNGDSIAHWDGNTLVIDTVGIKGVITLLGFDVESGVRKVLLANPTLHVVERITKSADGQQLVDEATWEDPAIGGRPYTGSTMLSYADDTPVNDFVCEDVGDRFGPNYGGGFK